MMLLALCCLFVFCAACAQNVKRERRPLEPLAASFVTMIDTAEKTMPAYDYETRAIRLISAMKSPLRRRKGNLCATFIAWTESATSLLASNMAQSLGFCNWFIVVYNTTGLSEQEMLSDLQDKLGPAAANSSAAVNAQPWVTVLAAPPKATAPNHAYEQCAAYARRFVDEQLLRFDQCKLIGRLADLPYNPALYSKASLMVFLLNTLPHYEYVWTLDGDISLSEFDATAFQVIHRCAFAAPPMVSQPLIHEPTQFYKYLYRWAWGHTDVLANTVGFIELQAALFEARYLEWFVMAFVVPLLSPMHVLGSDWGLDEMYCTAAKQYKAVTVSHAAAAADPICAVIVGNMAVHHTNVKTIKKVMGGRDTHLHLNYALMRIVHTHFRNFCSGGLQPENDPFHPNTSFVPSYRLVPKCRRV